jgi:hypothetical protein
LKDKFNEQAKPKAFKKAGIHLYIIFMNIKKVSSVLGIVALTFAAFFTALSAPKTIVGTVYYTVLGVCKSFTSSSGRFTTGGTTTQASLVASNGMTKSLWGACSTGTPSHAAHFHH